MSNSHTTIWVSRDFRDSLKSQMSKGESYEDFIAENLEIQE